MSKEFSTALAVLASRKPEDEAVHDARKSVKKIRSVPSSAPRASAFL